MSQIFAKQKEDLKWQQLFFSPNVLNTNPSQTLEVALTLRDPACKPY
ncbi:6785_t:CDS:2 [Funneliformis geosporum]|uniref:13942_t:CDS:1 n=1 Tax=Funneliformis geosporum TaxID=1117311 RepID=A0A9W4WPS6_9GLOM|nr:13942_t:CDS:2 [Funneliformis geosporum]CAI2173215.1 6785_t:CDS:2 [Funneliformis geosporum]